MKEEIRVGVEFLRQFLAKYGNQLTAQNIDTFASMLTELLHERYVNHWYADIPMKGQAFRCLRLKHSENYIDPVLEKILKDLDLTLNQLGLPNDFTLWIDPGEVSVRFGDQFGYTYTIARLDQSLQEDNILNKETNESNEVNKDLEKDQNVETNKPCLIVQNAENILFDEKLTAFIRQNSSNNNEDLISNLLDCSIMDITEEKEVANIDESIKLSAEKRTISPPCSSALQRKNSSNISIVTDKINNAASSFTSTLNDRTMLSWSDGINNVPNNMHSWNPSLNKFSYNDSCYYSSSSSSCASSFGSNNEESNLISNFAWFNNNNSNKNKNSKSNYFNSLSNNSNILYKEENLNNQLRNYLDSPQSQLPFSHTNSFFPMSSQRQNSFGFLNEPNLGVLNSSTLDSFNNANYVGNCFGPNTDNIYSEASSERSDTPNSCITNESSLSSNFPNFTSSNAIVPFSYEKNPFEFNISDSQKFAAMTQDKEKVLSTSSSTSSDTSTTTLSTNNKPMTLDEKDLPEFKVNKLKNLKKCDAIQKNHHLINKLNQINKKNEELASEQGHTKLERQQKQNSDKSKTEDKYCGYVESFPYYYKLNRLYNALAVQKMQTDRIRKNHNSSPMQFNQQHNSSASYSQMNNNSSTGPNNQTQNRNSNINMSLSPNQFQNLQNNQYLQNSILISSNSPPGQHSAQMNNIQNQHMNNMNQYLKSKSHQSKINNSNKHETSAKNIALSNYRNISQLSKHQQQQQTKSNFNNSQTSTLNNIDENKSSVNDNNSQMSIENAMNFAQQQQLMNTFYNQMNFRNSQDIVKLSN